MFEVYEIYELLKKKGIRVKLGRIHPDDLIAAAHIIVAISSNKVDWVNRVGKELNSALEGYTMIQFSKLQKSKDYWSYEVKKLLDGVTNMLNAKTTGFSKAKAFEEAKEQASITESQITSAVNEYIRMMRDEDKVLPIEIKKFREKLKKVNFTAKSLLDKMLQEFQEFQEFHTE